MTNAEHTFSNLVTFISLNSFADWELVYAILWKNWKTPTNCKTELKHMNSPLLL